MKNTSNFYAVLFALCGFSLPSYAQLEVLTSGDVKVSKHMAIEADVDTTVNVNVFHVSTNALPFYGIKSHIKTNNIMPTSAIYGICGYADASASYNTNLTNSPIIGVYGKASKPYDIETNFSAGVAGLGHYYGGIGIYGGIGTTMDLPAPTQWKGAAYAGYFDRTVKVNGTLIAANVSTTSDLRQKDIPEYSL